MKIVEFRDKWLILIRSYKINAAALNAAVPFGTPLPIRQRLKILRNPVVHALAALKILAEKTRKVIDNTKRSTGGDVPFTANY
jgi:hypothetical protein